MRKMSMGMMGVQHVDVCCHVCVFLIAKKYYYSLACDWQVGDIPCIVKSRNHRHLLRHLVRSFLSFLEEIALSRPLVGTFF